MWARPSLTIRHTTSFLRSTCARSYIHCAVPFASVTFHFHTPQPGCSTWLSCLFVRLRLEVLFIWKLERNSTRTMLDGSVWVFVSVRVSVSRVDTPCEPVCIHFCSNFVASAMFSMPVEPFTSFVRCKAPWKCNWVEAFLVVVCCFISTVEYIFHVLRCFSQPDEQRRNVSGDEQRNVILHSDRLGRGREKRVKETALTERVVSNQPFCWE